MRSPTGWSSCSACCPAIVMTSVFPLLSRYLAREPRARACARSTAPPTCSSRSACPLAAGGLVVAPQLVRLIGGEDFDGAADTAAHPAVRGRARVRQRPVRPRADRRRPPAQRAVARAGGAGVQRAAQLRARAVARASTRRPAVAVASELLLVLGGLVLVRRELGMTPRCRLLWRALLAAAAMAAVLVARRRLVARAAAAARRGVYVAGALGRSAASTGACWRLCAREGVGARAVAGARRRAHGRPGDPGGRAGARARRRARRDAGGARRRAERPDERDAAARGGLRATSTRCSRRPRATRRGGGPGAAAHAARPAAPGCPVRMVLDLYNPIVMEVLEAVAARPPRAQRRIQALIASRALAQLRGGGLRRLRQRAPARPLARRHGAQRADRARRLPARPDAALARSTSSRSASRPSRRGPRRSPPLRAAFPAIAAGDRVLLWAGGHLGLARPRDADPRDRQRSSARIWSFMGTGRPGLAADRAGAVRRARGRAGAARGSRGRARPLQPRLGPLRRARRLAARRRPRRDRAPRSPRGALLVSHAGARLPLGRPAGGRHARRRAGRARGARGPGPDRRAGRRRGLRRGLPRAARRRAAAQAAARERIASARSEPALGARPPARWWIGARASATLPAQRADAARCCAARVRARSTCARCSNTVDERGACARAPPGRDGACAARLGRRLSGYRPRRDDRRRPRASVRAGAPTRSPGVRARPRRARSRWSRSPGCRSPSWPRCSPRAGRSRARTACSPPTSCSTSPGSARRPSTG